MCAGRCGHLLNISSLATEAGITMPTCRSWLSYLTTGYIIHLLQPHHQNFNKKIVKTPKISFADTALLCYLLGIDSAESLSLHTFRGQVFENLVFTELLKERIHLGKDPGLWFWRDNHGTEIDFLMEDAGKMLSCEVKSGMNFYESYLENSLRYRKYNPALTKQFLVYDGTTERTVQDVQIINWRRVGEMADKV